VSRLSSADVRRREAAIAKLKLLVPALFALGFLFYLAITVFPLAGMPGPPPSPQGGVGPLLVWLASASACGGLFALFGGLVVALSASSDEDADR
jgi:membrane associated rhomboid family serine protease